MNPEIWGSHLWYILHIISFTYPNNPSEFDKRSYHDFYTSIKDVLPCEICKKHYKQHLATYPITPHLDSKENLIKWVIQIHNFANMSLNKPILEPNEVIYIYSKLNPISPFYDIDMKPIIEKRKNKKHHKIIFIIILLLFLILIMQYYFNKYYFYI